MSTVLKSNEALMGEYIKMLVWFISVLIKDIFCPPRDTIRTPAPHPPPPTKMANVRLSLKAGFH